eukprot:2755427-Ditylum_brightwellii.AAC.2
MNDIYNANESVLENDESTMLESDNTLSNASACLSEGVHAATVIGYAYGLQSFGSVMPEALSPVVQNLSHENGIGSGMQPKNITDVSMLPPLDGPTPITENAANAQEAVYSTVEMPHVVNKRRISDITRSVRDIVGDTEEFLLSHHSNSGHKQSLVRCSISSTGTIDGDITSSDNLNLFPAHQPIINQFLNHNKSSYDQ